MSVGQVLLTCILVLRKKFYILNFTHTHTKIFFVKKSELITTELNIKILILEIYLIYFRNLNLTEIHQYSLRTSSTYCSYQIYKQFSSMTKFSSKC